MIYLLEKMTAAFHHLTIRIRHHRRDTRDVERPVERSNEGHRKGIECLAQASIDRAKVQSLQVPIQDVFTTLQVDMGSLYVNQFAHQAAFKRRIGVRH